MNSPKLRIFLSLGLASVLMSGAAWGQDRTPASTSGGQALRRYLVSVQPIVVRDDQGLEPAPMTIPEDLIEQAYAPAGTSFVFFEPIFYDNAQARDGKINLDEIVRLTKENGIIKEMANLVHLIFVNTVDGKRGPLGRGMMNGNITFVALSDKGTASDSCMTAFSIAHEIGHNLNLKHAVDDPYVSIKTPNLMGDGPFCDRLGPKSLTPYQVEILKKSPLVRPRIDFLTQEEGRAQIADDSFDRFFTNLNRQEVASFSGRTIEPGRQEKISAEARRLFSEAVMNFTPDEKAALTWSVERINELLLKNGLRGMARHPWRFIKTENWLCGGFAYTRGMCIILSEKRAQDITRIWRNAESAGGADKALRNIGSFLVHEQMHVLQRVFPERFAGLYREKWGYVRANVESNESLEARKVTNPDAPRPEWLIPAGESADRSYWIRVVFGKESDIPKMGTDFVEEVFAVERKNGKWNLLTEAGRPLRLPLDSVAAFTRRFPVSNGIDHPNEIAAYMFGGFFREEILEGTPGKEKADKNRETYRCFIAWCKDQFK